MNDAASTLTMQDIADLARVQRPVVSTWRRRPMVRGRRIPFPAAVATTDGIERFDRAQIVEWLEQTGRGKNKEHRYDAPALAVPDGADLEELVTLLCLHALTERELAETTQRSRIALAQKADPSDALLLREVREHAPSRNTLRYVDDLIEASYGPGDALTRIEGSRAARERADRGLTANVLDVLRATARACARHSETDTPTLIGPTNTKLSLALATEFGRLVVDADTEPGRRTRRRAVIRGIDVRSEAPGPRVRVVDLLPEPIGTALDRIDEALLELGGRDIALILGSAGVLCDALRGEAEHQRSHSLRTGSLVLAARLPRGQWSEAHRQSLGLWVCRGTREPLVPHVVDLAGLTEAELDLADLTADVAGALAQTHTRAYRYARRTELAPALTGLPLVPRGVRVPRLPRPEPRPLDRIHSATLTTSRPMCPFDLLVAPAPSRVRLRRRSLGEMQAHRQISVKRGSRIKPEDHTGGGAVRVLPDPGLRLDPIDALTLYPRAARTDAGDVVFTEKPKPAAWVEDVGGSLVASPARIIRLHATAAVGPHLLAALINELAAPGTEWQTWSVPELPAAEMEALERALVSISAYEAGLRRRTGALRELKQALIEGISAGDVALDAHIPDYPREA